MKILVNLSNRHIHLTKQDFEAIFGSDATLTHKNDLLQPGQFAAVETVRLLIGGKELSIRVTGPFRSTTQCEILHTDACKLKIENVPVSDSGELQDSLPFMIHGYRGMIEKSHGLIISGRHIHLDPHTAAENNLADGEIVSLLGGVPKRMTTFHDVLVRVDEKFVPECHLDFDEGNGAGICNGDLVEVIKHTS